MPIRTPTLIAIVCALLLIVPEIAAAESGAVGTTDEPKTVPGSKAKLVKGKAIPPEDAPRAVKRVIRAANAIRNKPYRYGGGHGSFEDSGYDCSGAVSYALRGARLIDRPYSSWEFKNWGRRGKGNWITVYGARSHAYMVVAGLRFDTSRVRGNGPGWSRDLESTPERYVKRRIRRL